MSVVNGTGLYSISQVGADFYLSHNGVTASVSLPLTLTNTSPGPTSVLTLQLTSNIALTSSSQYITINSDYITIDGNDQTITLASISNYSGLVANSGFSTTTLNNIVIDGTSSSTALNAGWLGQANYGVGGSTTSIINCRVFNGSISTAGGGVVGAGCQSVQFTNCYATGNMTGTNAGGICGANAQNCIFTNCYWAVSTTGFTSCGGICGAGAQYCAVDTSYTLPDIADNSGGIFGPNAVQCSAFQCYSIGNMGLNAGGIFGANSNQCVATQCYTAGIATTPGNGIFGTTTNPTSSYDNRADNTGSWNDNNAGSTLNSLGTVWQSIASQTPFLLLAYNRNFYDGATAATIAYGGPPNITDFTVTALATNFLVAAVDGAPNPGGIEVDIFEGQLWSTYYNTGTDYVVDVLVLNGEGAGTVEDADVYDYNFTSVSLTVTFPSPTPTPTPSSGSGRRIPSIGPLFTNNAQVYYKSHSLSVGSCTTVRNSHIKARRT
jgi:hypothetical protein